MDLPLDFSPLRFSSDDLRARDRLSAWRDFYGPRVNGADLEPVGDVPFRADVILRMLPGFGLTTTTSSAARFARTRRFLADGRDSFGLHLSFAGGACGQRGREISCNPETAVLMTVAEPGWIVSSQAMRFWGLWFTRYDLAPLVAGLEDKLLQPIASDSEPMRYLVGYVHHLEQQPSLADPALARTVALHMRDLFALALGATRDASVVAEGRGLRAARLQAIKRYISENLPEPALSVGTVAVHHRVTPRYVQRMFETEGTTFSEFVLNKRLSRVHRMLVDPQHAKQNVSAIALAAGFNDVSYFNRRFRRRYGASPRDVRAWGRELASVSAAG